MGGCGASTRRAGEHAHGQDDDAGVEQGDPIRGKGGGRLLEHYGSAAAAGKLTTPADVGWALGSPSPSSSLYNAFDGHTPDGADENAPSDPMLAFAGGGTGMGNFFGFEGDKSPTEEDLPATESDEGRDNGQDSSIGHDGVPGSDSANAATGQGKIKVVVLFAKGAIDEQAARDARDLKEVDAELEERRRMMRDKKPDETMEEFLARRAREEEDLRLSRKPGTWGGGLGNLWAWAWTGDSQADDGTLATAFEGAGRAYTANAGLAHQALAGLTWLGTLTSEALALVEGDDLHRVVMQGAPPEPPRVHGIAVPVGDDFGLNGDDLDALVNGGAKAVQDFQRDAQNFRGRPVLDGGDGQAGAQRFLRGVRDWGRTLIIVVGSAESALANGGGGSADENALTRNREFAGTGRDDPSDLYDSFEALPGHTLKQEGGSDCVQTAIRMILARRGQDVPEGVDLFEYFYPAGPGPDGGWQPGGTDFLDAEETARKVFGESELRYGEIGDAELQEWLRDHDLIVELDAKVGPHAAAVEDIVPTMNGTKVRVDDPALGKRNRGVFASS